MRPLHSSFPSQSIRPSTHSSDRSESAEIHKASVHLPYTPQRGVPASDAQRYVPHSPDEYPFTTGLPDPVLPPLEYPPILHPNEVNVNVTILSFYVRSIVPRVTAQASLVLASLKRSKGTVGGGGDDDDGELADDGNYGSAATLDVEVLQAISKRVHYGSSFFPSFLPTYPPHATPHALPP